MSIMQKESCERVYIALMITKIKDRLRCFFIVLHHCDQGFLNFSEIPKISVVIDRVFFIHIINLLTHDVD